MLNIQTPWSIASRKRARTPTPDAARKEQEGQETSWHTGIAPHHRLRNKALKPPGQVGINPGRNRNAPEARGLTAWLGTPAPPSRGCGADCSRHCIIDKV